MFDRITSNPAILGGKPIIRGTRISVEMILEWVASGRHAMTFCASTPISRPMMSSKRSTMPPPLYATR